MQFGLHANFRGYVDNMIGVFDNKAVLKSFLML